MKLITLAPRPVTLPEFIEVWEPYYSEEKYPDVEYDENMKRPLTPEKALELFKWKNGRRLSSAKEASVRRHFIESSEPLPTGDDDAALIAYLAQDTGGVIFRVFWLHCNNPEKFPIFDRRAYDAMAHILGWKGPEVLSKLSYEKQAAMYVDHYRPFFKGFGIGESRRLDRALWAFGEFVDTYGKMF